MKSRLKTAALVGGVVGGYARYKSPTLYASRHCYDGVQRHEPRPVSGNVVPLPAYLQQ